MALATLSSSLVPWLSADDDVSTNEVLAVIGVVVWGGSFLWMVVSDILDVCFKHDDHHARHGQHEQYGDSRRRARQWSR